MRRPLTITVEEAADPLGISRTSAYLWAARGETPTRRLGRRVLVLCDPPSLTRVVAFNRNIWLTQIMATRTAGNVQSAPAAAADLADALSSMIATGRQASVTVEDRTVILPTSLASALVELLEDISEGRDVTTAPAGLPLGTEVASELLGVSRPWFTTLLDRGDIPSVRVGSKRRVRLGDLLAYRRSDDARRSAGLTWEFLDEE